MSKQQRIIYGYDAFHHEKYHCSVDYFIDNYKDFSKDDLTFRMFHSKEERDSFALDSYREELLCDGDHYPIPNDPSATKDAKNYLDNLKDIKLDIVIFAGVVS